MKFTRLRPSRFFTVVFLFFVGLLFLNAQEEHKATIVTILERYTELMKMELDQEEDLPLETWKTILQAINNGFLRFSVNPDMEGLLIDGVVFQVNPRQEIQHIIFSPSFLNLHENHPAAVYAVLTREFKSARDFFMNPQSYIRSFQDPLAQAILRIDAALVETLFIRDRLINSEYEIGLYEQFLLDSLEKDGLTSALIFLEHLSLPMATSLEAVRLNFEEDNDEEVLRNFVLELGEQIQEEWKAINKEDASLVYPAVVLIYSWLEFTPWIISRIHNKEAEARDFKEILEIETDYQNLYQNFLNIREQENFLMEQVYMEIRKGFYPS